MQYRSSVFITRAKKKERKERKKVSVGTRRSSERAAFSSCVSCAKKKSVCAVDDMIVPAREICSEPKWMQGRKKLSAEMESRREYCLHAPVKGFYIRRKDLTGNDTFEYSVAKEGTLTKLWQNSEDGFVKICFYRNEIIWPLHTVLYFSFQLKHNSIPLSADEFYVDVDSTQSQRIEEPDKKEKRIHLLHHDYSCRFLEYSRGLMFYTYPSVKCNCN